MNNKTKKNFSYRAVSGCSDPTYPHSKPSKFFSIKSKTKKTHSKTKQFCQDNEYFVSNISTKPVQNNQRNQVTKNETCDPLKYLQGPNMLKKSEQKRSQSITRSKNVHHLTNAKKIKTPFRAKINSISLKENTSLKNIKHFEMHASVKDTGIRLQKALADCGFGSRRLMDEWIEEGRLKVNGVLAVLGQRIQKEDTVELNGKKINLIIQDRFPKVLIYHKPEGEIVSRHDPEGRPSIFDGLPKLRGERWIPIGRLDFNTCGLLLLTTSGKLADLFMHPRNEIEREYAVRIRGQLSDEQIQRLKNGVILEDGLAQILNIEGPFMNEAEKNAWYHVTLKEGRNREVRRLFESINANLTRLMRIRYGTVKLPETLRRGYAQRLSDNEVTQLIKSNFPEQASGFENTLREKTSKSHKERKKEEKRLRSKRASTTIFKKK